MKLLKDITLTAVFMMIVFIGWQWLEYHYYGCTITNKADSFVFMGFATSVYFNMRNMGE